MNKWLLTLIIGLWSAIACAVDPATALMGYLDKIKSYDARFVQNVKGDSGFSERSTGQLVFKRPGKFLWSVKKPSTQQIIADGKTIWIYDKDLMQVTIQPMRKSIGSRPAMVLGGNLQEIKRSFVVSRLKRSGGEWFSLRPKGASSFKWMQLGFSGNQLRNMIFEDNIAQRVNIQFSSVKTNTKVSNRLFQFKVPRGVDVVKQL